MASRRKKTPKLDPRLDLRDEVCSDCGKVFPGSHSAEEKLLRAIFGQSPLCTSCRRKAWPVCTECESSVDPSEVFLFERKPYHSTCLPYS